MIPARIAQVARTALPNQVAISLGSFVSVVVAARGLAPTGFGLFASIQVTMLFLVGVFNAAVLMPVMIDPTADATRPVAEVRRAAFLLGIAGLAVGVGFASLLSGDARSVVLAIALGMPGALYWDIVRMHYTGRPANLRLLPGDVLVAVVLIGWTWATVELHAPLFVVFLGPVLGPTVASFVLLPPWSPRWTSWRRPWPRRISANMAGDYIISTGLDQLLTLLTAIFLSAAALGGLRLAQTALGPVSTLGVAMGFTVLPMMRELPLSGAGKLRWAMLRFGPVALLALLIGAGLLLLPLDVGRFLLGASWEIAAPVVLPVSVYSAASVLGRAATRALITSGASGSLVVTRAVSAAVTAVVCVIVLMHDDLELYAWSAAALLSATTVALCIVAARAAPQPAAQTPIGEPT